MNTYQFKQTGGARYALLSATWPLATLTVTENQLILNLPLCTLYFRPADVLSIEPYDRGFTTNGLVINHTVPHYKMPVVFRPSGDVRETIGQIAQTGFTGNKKPLPIDLDTTITSLQLQGGFAMKVPALIIIVVIWNALATPELYRVVVQNKPQDMFMGMRLATGFMVLICLTLILSAPFQNLVLKEGRTFNDIGKFIYFLLAICSIMFLVSLSIRGIA
jgi:hypothetical protein